MSRDLSQTQAATSPESRCLRRRTCNIVAIVLKLFKLKPNMVACCASLGRRGAPVAPGRVRGTGDARVYPQDSQLASVDEEEGGPSSPPGAGAAGPGPGPGEGILDGAAARGGATPAAAGRPGCAAAIAGYLPVVMGYIDGITGRFTSAVTREEAEYRQW